MVVIFVEAANGHLLFAAPQLAHPRSLGNDCEGLRAAPVQPADRMKRFCGGRHERYLARGRPVASLSPALVVVAEFSRPTARSRSELYFESLRRLRLPEARHDSRLGLLGACPVQRQNHSF